MFRLRHPNRVDGPLEMRAQCPEVVRMFEYLKLISVVAT
jgi:hypothetical protein